MKLIAFSSLVHEIIVLSNLNKADLNGSKAWQFKMKKVKALFTIDAILPHRTLFYFLVGVESKESETDLQKITKTEVVRLQKQKYPIFDWTVTNPSRRNELNRFLTVSYMVTLELGTL